MAPKLGVQQGYLGLFDAQLGDVKMSPKDPKSLRELAFGPNFSVVIEAANPENFRSPWGLGLIQSFFY